MIPNDEQCRICSQAEREKVLDELIEQFQSKQDCIRAKCPPEASAVLQGVIERLQELRSSPRSHEPTTKTYTKPTKLVVEQTEKKQSERDKVLLRIHSIIADAYNFHDWENTVQQLREWQAELRSSPRSREP